MVPVIAKSDCMTQEERREYVSEVQKMLTALQTKAGMPVVYDFSSADTTGPDVSPSTLSSVDYYSLLREDYPWVVWLRSVKTKLMSLQHVMSCDHWYNCDVCSNEESELSTDNKQSLPKVFSLACTADPGGLRQYPFGTVDTYNSDHSDLRRLQTLLLESGVHLMAMIRTTEQMSIALQRKWKTRRQLWQCVGAMVVTCALVTVLMIPFLTSFLIGLGAPCGTDLM